MPIVAGITVSQDVLALSPELQELAAMPVESPSKYKNVRAEMQGMRFQSGHEATEVGKLILLEKHQMIFGLRLQVPFPLPGGLVYVPDAVYLDSKLNVVILDAKAWDVKTRKFLLTKEFRLKRKLFEERYYPHKITLV